VRIMEQPHFLEGDLPQSKKRITKTSTVGCDNCTLNGRVQYKCPSFGNPRSRIWWVGEAPGKDEAEALEPFVGVSGKFHWEQVQAVLGIPKQNMYTGNVVLCWPEGNRTPTNTEIKHCVGNIENEIKQHKPIVIGALGTVPFQALTGLKDPISEVVGQEFIRKDGVKVLPFYHPSYLLRLGKPQSMIDLYRMHLRRILISAKSRERSDFAKAAGYKVELLDAKRWVQYLDFIKRNKGWCSLDLETKKGKIPFLISSAYGGKAGFVAYWDEVAELTREFFEDASIGKVFQNGASFDIPVIEKMMRCRVRGYLWDTFIAGVTLDSRKGRNNLSRLTEWALPEIAGYDGEVNRLVDKLGCKDDYSKLPVDLAIPYAGYDAISTAFVYLKQKPLAYEPLIQFYMELMREVLYPLENFGVNIDVDLLDKMIAFLEIEVERTGESIRRIAGGDRDFNPNSNAQIAKLLFGKLKISTAGIRKSKKTQLPAVDKETFVTLAGKHPVIDLIKTLRTDGKMLSTYGKRIKNELVDGRFHVKYWIAGDSKEDEEHGTETGRLSSPLQNIPRVDKDHPRRFEPADMFVPDKGMVLLVPDYSQAELRTAAIISRDTAMIEDFQRGFDAHTSVCHRYLGVPENEVPSKAIRVRAKGINFAKIFGAGVNKLAQQTGLTVVEVLKLFQQDKLAYPNYWKWRRWQIEKAAQDRCVYTLFGFKRPLDTPDYFDYKELELEHWMKQALNTPIQGTAAQIVLLAQLIIKRMNLPCTMLMNIHDSVPMQVLHKNLEKVAERVKYAMEVAIVDEVWKRFKKDISAVPWVAELEWGERLGKLKPFEIN
jgi:uracil-DNA glycosylase family 4